MDPKVGVTRPRRRQAQKVKALAQHKDSVTRVTECHHVSLPNDSRPGGPRSRCAKRGGGISGSPGGDAERRQKAGTMAHCWCRPCPPPQLQGLSTLQEGGTYQLFRGLAWETNAYGRRMQTFQKPYGGSVSTRSFCGFPGRHAVG